MNKRLNQSTAEIHDTDDIHSLSSFLPMARHGFWSQVTLWCILEVTNYYRM